MSKWHGGSVEMGPGEKKALQKFHIVSVKFHENYRTTLNRRGEFFHHETGGIFIYEGGHS
jgi:hypothetical protein